MAGAPVEFKDIESIVEAWKMHNTPFFSLWQGSNLKYVHEEEDTTEAEEKLRQSLEAIQQSQTTAIYTLRSHRDAKNFNNKKEYKGSFTFRLADYDFYRPNGRNGDNGIVVVNPVGRNTVPTASPVTTSLEDKLDKLIQLNTLLIEQKIQEDEYDEEEEEEEEEELSYEEKMQRTTQMVGAVVQQVQPLVSQVLEFFANINNKNNHSQNSTFMAGSTTEVSNLPLQERCDNAAQILQQILGVETYVNSLEKLAKMAQDNPSKLKSMLMFL